VIADPLMPDDVAVVTTVPLVAGNVNVVDPAIAGACKVTVPEVSPDMTTELIIYFLFVILSILRLQHRQHQIQ
jgi:hypothetical protein